MKTQNLNIHKVKFLQPISARTLESGRIGLAQLIERLTAEWEVADTIPGPDQYSGI